MQRFFGGNPVLVVIRLMIISVIVGVVLSVLGLDPRDIIDSFFRLVNRVYEMGFDAIEWSLRYFLLGAVIVFPIWVVSRIFRVIGRSGSGTSVGQGSRRSDV